MCGMDLAGDREEVALGGPGLLFTCFRLRADGSRCIMLREVSRLGPVMCEGLGGPLPPPPLPLLTLLPSAPAPAPFPPGASLAGTGLAGWLIEDMGGLLGLPGAEVGALLAPLAIGSSGMDV